MSFPRAPKNAPSSSKLSGSVQGTGREFEPNCRFFGKKEFSRYNVPENGFKPMLFQLQEKFDDGSIYSAFSTGNHKYIDTSVSRNCVSSCPCLYPNGQPNVGDFTFTVYKTASTMEIRNMSEWLRKEILHILPLCEYSPEPEYSLLPKDRASILIHGNGSLNGFFLLKHYALLSTHLASIQSICTARSNKQQLYHVQELSLLVNGLLTDHEAFAVYDFEELYAWGFIDNSQKEAFQYANRRKISKDIDELESAIHCHHPLDSTDRRTDDTSVLDGDFWSMLLDGMEVSIDAVVSSKHTSQSYFQQTSNEYSSIQQPASEKSFSKQSSQAESKQPVSQAKLAEEWPQRTWLPSIPPRHPGQATQIGPLGSFINWASAQPQGQDFNNGCSGIKFSYESIASSAYEEPLSKCGSLAKKLKLQQLRKLTSVMLRKERLGRVYSEFVKQHAIVTEASRQARFIDNLLKGDSHSSCQIGDTHHVGWSQHIEEFPDQAWKDGIKAIRRTCDGLQPETLNQTLMFLTIVKAISAILDSDELSDHGAHFTEDLHRWQILFPEDNGRLQDFRDAVLQIWHVRLESNLNVIDDYEALFEFQKIASIFISDSVHLLKEKGHIELSLLQSQRWCRQKDNGVFTKEQIEIGSGDVMLDNEWNGRRSCFDFPHKDSIGLRGFNDSEYEDVRLWSLKDNCFSDPKLVLLMAGAIFGILITFLIGLESLAIHNTTESLFPQTVTHARVQQPVIDGALEHIFSLPRACDVFCEVSLHEIKSKAELAVLNGTIPSLSQFVNVIAEAFQETDSLSVSAVESFLFEFRRSWYATYVTQGTYRAIAVYLGLKGHFPIVKHLSTPRHYPPEGLSNAPPIICAVSCHDQTPISSTVLQTPHSPFISQTRSETTDNSPSSSIWSQSTKTESISFVDASPLPQSMETQSSSVPQNRTFCRDCNRNFSSVSNYNKHRKDKHSNGACRVRCQYGCGKDFSRDKYRKTHEEKKHKLNWGVAS